MDIVYLFCVNIGKKYVTLHSVSILIGMIKVK